MSEEILKALMQLFAIISKQDDGVTDAKREYVRVFLRQQISEDLVEEYLALFEKFAEEKKRKRKSDAASDEPEKKLTSVKDSVRILGICKKINKTLTKQQKVVVLMRLFELVNADRNFSEQRIAIIDTAANVFNVTKEEYDLLETFVRFDQPQENNINEVLLITGHPEKYENHPKVISSDHLAGNILVLRIPSVNLYFLRYTGGHDVKLNGFVLNKQRIYLFANGSTVKPPLDKPIYYSDVASRYLTDSSTTRLSFEAKDIEYRFAKGNLGVRGVTIAEGPGSLIGIMGASGAGKTTLLNVLSGIDKPSNGSVTINGIDLHRENDQLKGVIGYVPQDDLLIEELTVYQNVYYNAKLCFRDLSEEEIDGLVIKVIDNLGLSATKDLRVGNPLDKTISGGQRKRLNIGLELIREPSILFLDEPTSGLSSRDSENVLDLLRELTLKGKLIFVVIHQPSSDLYKMFDKVLLLDTGGYQIYYGNPVEAVIYFKTIDNQVNSQEGECPHCGNVNPEVLFNIVEARVVDEFGQLTDKRKVAPKKWRDFYTEHFEEETVETVKETPPSTLRIPNRLKQMWLFFSRDILSKLSNRQYLLINLLEAPALAFFLSFIIRYIENPNSSDYLFRVNENIPAYIFISIVVALFIGLTVSAEEIYRDRKILKREAFLNLSRMSYLFSKLGILFSLSALQSFTFVLIGNLILGVEGMLFPYWLILFSVSCFANVLGLNISASFNSAVTIYILIPLLIIPQMILGGAMFSFEKLNRSIGGGIGNQVPYIAEFMPSRWAYEALVVHQFVHNDYEQLFYSLKKKESFCDYKQVVYIPELESLLSNVEAYVNQPVDSLKPDFEHDLNLLYTEIKITLERVSSVEFDAADQLTPESIDADVIEATSDFLMELKTYYTILFNSVNLRKDEMINRMTDSPEKQANYLSLYNDHYNEYLEELLKKTFTKHPVFEYEGRLVQQIDPIYLDPEVGNPINFRAHFYAPTKPFFGQLFSTLYFNASVIWVMTLLLFVSVYFDLLSKALAFGERLFSGIRK
ncbi:MAG: ATP-binding cassette domain-containing protein [Salibacteraceae bacterium]